VERERERERERETDRQTECVLLQMRNGISNKIGCWRKYFMMDKEG
jgi:hypothetical protein